MVIDFFTGTKEKIVLALGFFDAVHLGHRKLIEKAKSKVNSGEKLGVFTIDGSFFKNFDGNVYTLQEKCEILKSLGVDYVFCAKATKEFFDTTGQEFLDVLLQKYNISACVCGQDFTFGKNAAYNSSNVRDFCLKNDIRFEEENLHFVEGKKVSTSDIKLKLANGDIKTANKLLVDAYFVTGKVVRGRGEGSGLVFPTANVLPPKDKLELKHGVYATKVLVDGKSYNALTNYGQVPTFEQEKVVIESFILDFKQDIYNKEIKIYFLDYLREIKKFNSANELKAQITRDMEYFL